VILPTRGRTESLKKSLLSLINHAANPERIEILLGVDDDDQESHTWARTYIFPELIKKNINAIQVEFQPMGYIRLHEYVNSLAKFANGRWIMFWNDDAVMETKHWDQKITQHDGEFVCLRMPTHNQHPYAIFPIVPREWYYLFERLSPHQLSDAWISQVAYMAGIMRTVDIQVRHERYDLTGDNHDETYKNRPMLEGNHDDPRDFNHISWRRRRLDDCNKIAWYLNLMGKDTSWFQRVIRGEQDPWEEMTNDINDPNGQIKVHK
jgi:hypothetical protein